MPAPRTKQYRGVSAAGSNTPTTSKRISPNTPNRLMLTIQNTGANPGLLHFSEPVQGDGSDILFAVGQILIFDQPGTCPTEAINVGSTLGTTWALLEQVQGQT
jgi:hypothetical protein